MNDIDAPALLTDERIEEIRTSNECWTHTGMRASFIPANFARLVESASRGSLLAALSQALAERDELRIALTACSKHIKRTPRICRDIYIGSDGTSFGAQAISLAKRVDAALAGRAQTEGAR
jgi:hypothetical protein